MGCIKSKEDKGPTMKYRPDNAPVSDVIGPHVGHYGPDPTQLQQNQPSSTGPAAGFNPHTITPFGGASSIMTPFGGASTSFSGALPGTFPGAVSSETCLYYPHDPNLRPSSIAYIKMFVQITS